MNKYNIQAIRKELEDCVRNARWKAFRSRFQGLNDELAHAVVMNQQKRKHQQRKPFLLFILSFSRQHRNSLPLPVDVLELAIRSSSKSLLTTNPTALAIALDHSAPLNVLETLLLHDTTKKSLYVSDRKSGDTPLLFAIKHQLDEDIIKLLIQSDPTRQSLLLNSKKRNRTPLFYSANEGLQFMRKDDVDLPVDLQYILLQTYMAVDIKSMPTTSTANDGTPIARVEDHENYESNHPRFSHCDNDNDDNYAFDDDNDDFIDYDITGQEHWMTLVEATIATAHLLGTKSTGKLLAFLVPKALACQSQSCVNDNTTDILLHHVCNATEEQSFLEPNISIPSSLSSSSSSEANSLVQVLLQVNPQAPLIPNEKGQLPLHLAIMSKKSWEFLKRISSTVSARVPDANGSLPLHLALQHYTDNSQKTTTDDVVTEIWKLYPEANSVVDVKTRLFPFQLAAAAASLSSSLSSSATTSTSNKLSTNEAVSNSYFFLRSSPQVLNQYTL